MDYDMEGARSRQGLQRGGGTPGLYLSQNRSSEQHPWHEAGSARDAD